MPLTLKTALLLLVVAAGIYDLRFRRIPNWLSVSGVVIGLMVNAALAEHGLVQHGLALSATGMLLAAVVYLPLYLIRGMGAGDVKLMAAVGAIAGPGNWLYIFLATATIAGAASLFVVVIRHRVRETARNIVDILTALLKREKPSKTNEQLDVRSDRALRMPHGAFIASGAMFFLVSSEWLR